MAHTLFIFGFIESDIAAYHSKGCDVWAMQKRNASIIRGRSTPPSANYLETTIFSCNPDFERSEPSTGDVFREQVIHFGGSYHAMSADTILEDEGWLTEFESLLPRLYWSSATVRAVSEIFAELEIKYELDPSIWDEASDRYITTTKWTRTILEHQTSAASLKNA